MPIEKNTRKWLNKTPKIALILMSAWVLLLAVQASCFAENAALSWDPSTGSTIAGYKVYYNADSSALPFKGTGAVEGPSPIDVHNWTNTTVTGLDPKKTYYFAVTAYDTSGAESSYSNIVTIPATTSAPTPTTTPPPTSTTTSLLQGDINGDGKVDLADALLAMQMAVGTVQPTSDQLARGDVAPLVNGKPSPDGKINTADAVVILQKIIGTASI